LRRGRRAWREVFGDAASSSSAGRLSEPVRRGGGSEPVGLRSRDIERKARLAALDCVRAIVRRVADAPEAPEREPPIGCHLPETALPWLAGVAGPSVLGSEAQGHP